MQKKATITIHNGEIQIETNGFVGKSCVTETQFIKDILGTSKAQHLKPVYWQKEKETTKRYIPLCG